MRSHRYTAQPCCPRGSIGGRLAQTIGPFRYGTFGLLVGAAAMVCYGHAPSGLVMLSISIVHAINDGLTVSSSGVAVGLVVPVERQASAQGLLGGAETLVAGITATVIGQIYQHLGRTIAYTTTAAAMLALTAARRARRAWGPSFRAGTRNDNAPGTSAESVGNRGARDRI